MTPPPGPYNSRRQAIRAAMAAGYGVLFGVGRSAGHGFGSRLLYGRADAALNRAGWPDEHVVVSRVDKTWWVRPSRRDGQAAPRIRIGEILR